MVRILILNIARIPNELVQRMDCLLINCRRLILYKFWAVDVCSIKAFKSFLMSILSHVSISSMEGFTTSLFVKFHRRMNFCSNFFEWFVFTLLIILFSCYAAFRTNWHKFMTESSIKSFLIENIIITLVACIKGVITLRKPMFLIMLFLFCCVSNND